MDKTPIAESFTVLGMGSFGTALAWMLDQRGYRVRWWGRSASDVEGLRSERRNPRYLSDIVFSERMTATTDLAEALRGTQAVVSVVPAQYSRSVWQSAGHYGFGVDGRPVCCASKGIEIQSLKTLDAVYAELFGEHASPYACISGPTFARELVDRQPSVAVVASHDERCAQFFQKALSQMMFRIYTQSDVAGVELAGALKNVVAIATGISVGMDMGHNSRAAIITRGLAEMTKIAVAQGGSPTTMLGLAGIGDLILTCSGPLSRNRTLGERLGRGETLAQIQAGSGQVAEGVDTSRAAARLARKLGIEVPVIFEINEVLFNDKSPQQAWRDLMGRALGDEVDSMGVGAWLEKHSPDQDGRL